MTDEKYSGAFLEYSSYGMLPIFKLLGFNYQDVSIESILGDRGIDVYTEVHFHYPGSLATAKAGAGVKSEGQLIIAGTKGYILVPAPWWLTSRFEVHNEDPDDVQVHEVAFLGSGLRYEISNFIHLVRGDDDRYPKLTAEESIAMAGVFERYLEGSAAFRERI